MARRIFKKQTTIVQWVLHFVNPQSSSGHACVASKVKSGSKLNEKFMVQANIYQPSWSPSIHDILLCKILLSSPKDQHDKTKKRSINLEHTVLYLWPEEFILCIQSILFELMSLSYVLLPLSFDHCMLQPSSDDLTWIPLCLNFEPNPLFDLGVELRTSRWLHFFNWHFYLLHYTCRYNIVDKDLTYGTRTLFSALVAPWILINLLWLSNAVFSVLAQPLYIHMYIYIFII